MKKYISLLFLFISNGVLFGMEKKKNPFDWATVLVNEKNNGDVMYVSGSAFDKVEKIKKKKQKHGLFYFAAASGLGLTSYFLRNNEYLNYNNNYMKYGVFPF